MLFFCPELRALWTLPTPILCHCVYVTIHCPSVCLSRRSTAAATCGWFAAELGRGRQTSIDQCLPAPRIPATGRYLPLAPELSGGRRRVESRGSRLNADSLYDVQVRFEPVVFVDADVDVAFRQLLVVGGTARQHRLQTTIQSAISEQIR